MGKSKNIILKWISDEQQNTETMADTLTRIVHNPTKMKAWLDLVITNPRDNKPAWRAITQSFPTVAKKRAWIESYRASYTDYMNAYFTHITKIEDIVRVFPNLTPWTLEQRFGTIRIGTVPTIFADTAGFESLLKQINVSKVVKTFKKIKKLECHLPDFQTAFPAVKKIDWFDFGARSAFLKELITAKCGRAFTVRVGDHKFQVRFLCNPFSSKMVFQIKAENENYILKTAPYQFLSVHNDRVRKEHENMAIRADSTYSDALLEFYLKLNNCPNAPDILYYHFNREAALYRMETGKPFHTGINQNKYLDFYSFNTRVIPDATRLGIYVNDIHRDNFLVSDTDHQVKIIDIGHASYCNPMTPGIPGMTFTLGKLCGRDYISCDGVLEMEDV